MAPARPTKPTKPPRAARETFERAAPVVLDDDGAALLRVLCADPADLAARAAFAAHLRAKGDPRGAYIELALLDAPGPDDVERRDELFDRHGPDWQRAILPVDPRMRGALRDFGFHRGFVESASIQIREPALVDWLVERAPIAELRISDYEAPPQWREQLAGHPVLRQLRSLEISTTSPVEIVFERASLPRLEQLTLAAPFTTALARAIASSCPNLRRLTLRHASDALVPSAALAIIAALPVRELDLSAMTLDEAGAAAIAAMTSLTSLRIAHTFGALAPLQSLRSDLTSFALLHTPLGDGLAPFLAQAALRQVRHLELAQTGLTADNVARVLGALSPRSLVHLDISRNELAAPGAAALAGVRSLQNLTSVVMSQCGFDGAAFAALARAEWPLVDADFAIGRLEEDGARALAAGPLCRSLRTLGLSMTKAGSGAAELLAEAPWLANLESLFLFSNKMGSVGLRAILERMQNARKLSLCRENSYADEGLKVAARGFLPRLRSLRIDDAKPKNLIAFVESGCATDLRAASFGHAEIDVGAATALASLPKLGACSIAWSKVEPAAAEILAARWPRSAS